MAPNYRPEEIIAGYKDPDHRWNYTPAGNKLFRDLVHQNQLTSIRQVDVDGSLILDLVSVTGLSADYNKWPKKIWDKLRNKLKSTIDAQSKEVHEAGMDQISKDLHATHVGVARGGEEAESIQRLSRMQSFDDLREISAASSQEQAEDETVSLLDLPSQEPPPRPFASNATARQPSQRPQPSVEPVHAMTSRASSSRQRSQTGAVPTPSAPAAPSSSNHRQRLYGEAAAASQTPTTKPKLRLSSSSVGDPPPLPGANRNVASGVSKNKAPTTLTSMLQPGLKPIMVAGTSQKEYDEPPSSQALKRNKGQPQTRAEGKKPALSQSSAKSTMSSALKVGPGMIATDKAEAGTSSSSPEVPRASASPQNITYADALELRDMLEEQARASNTQEDANRYWGAVEWVADLSKQNATSAYGDVQGSQETDGSVLDNDSNDDDGGGDDDGGHHVKAKSHLFDTTYDY